VVAGPYENIVKKKANHCHASIHFCPGISGNIDNKLFK